MLDSAVVYTLLFISLYFEVFMLVAFLERKFSRAQAFTVAHTFPSVAIVVPCFNEEKTVTSTLQSLLKLDYPAISSNLSWSMMDRLIRPFKLQSISSPIKHRRFRLRCTQRPNGGKHSAMNFALTKTSAEIIGCLDADSEVTPSSLKAAVVTFADSRVAAITPGIHIKKPQNMLQHMQFVEYRLSVFMRFMMAALGSAFITPGAFSIFRTSAVRSLGGWRHGHSTEDMEMALRMQEAGYLIANVPAAAVYTATPRNLRALFRQRVRWNYGFLRNAFDYRHMFANRAYGNLGIFVLPAFAPLHRHRNFLFLANRILGSFVAFSYRPEDTRDGHLSAIRPFYKHAVFRDQHHVVSYLYGGCAHAYFIIAGTMIGTNKKAPPRATPLFLMFYSFLIPVWLVQLWCALYLGPAYSGDKDSRYVKWVSTDSAYLCFFY
jgi:cellulose synthase/poly-beta-1,6-N-acetylglucosamine synthase-like glycosyltransferase